MLAQKDKNVLNELTDDDEALQEDNDKESQTDIDLETKILKSDIHVKMARAQWHYANKIVAEEKVDAKNNVFTFYSRRYTITIDYS